MDIKALKEYIYDNEYVVQILESIGCHHIIYHSNGDYYTCANHDGDNKSAITVYNDESLICINYTRQMVKSNRVTDIVDLVAFAKDMKLGESLKYITEEIGLSYYHDFEEDEPECFKILKMLQEMDSNENEEREEPLRPISEDILGYYKPYVNNIFYEDNISYSTQIDFEVGYDEESNRYTIPIRSEIGDLVGVKGRYFWRDIPEWESKYIYLEPCPKSKLLFGLYKTLPYIIRLGKVFVCESEKAVMQCWSMGYRNVVGTGGKTISNNQIDLLVRLGVDIVLCFDKDVEKEEISLIADRFPEGVPLWYMYDEDDILLDHESPSDDKNKWEQLVENNIYKIR